MDRFDAMKLFIRVADTGSFSKAAKAAGVGQPTVSKQIDALETRLGAQLFRRTTRGLSVTGAGQDFYESASRVLADLEAAESRIGHGQLAPSGPVRVAMSPAFGRMYVVPRLPEFFERFPEVTVDFDISQRHVNLIEDGIDVAIRIGHVTDAALTTRLIGSMEFATVAAPSYLETHGEPATPQELEKRDAVVFTFRGTARPWDFRSPTGPLSIIPKGPVRMNDSEHVRAAVRAGLGIGHNAGWLFASDLASGAVRQVLKDYVPAPYPINAVTPGRRLVPSKVKAFIDFLAEVCAENETLKIR
jgi:LysR family transcriptional regulator for bpeEF and oprC